MNHTSTAFINAERKVVEDNTLPKSYGRTEAFLLPKDPQWMFLLWEITNGTYDFIKQENGLEIFDAARQIVRLYKTDNNAKYWDYSVLFSAGSWYLQVPESGESYIADLGLLTNDGKFILIARSNAVATAPGRVSEKTDEKWMVVEENFQKLLSMSGARYIGMGASERVQVLQDTWKGILGPEGMPSSWNTSNMSSKAVVSAEEEDDMWLRVHAEIIVYGQASPGAKVTINGKEIELTADGSFSLRQALNKGDVLDLPIKATKKDMQRSAKIHASREE